MTHPLDKVYRFTTRDHWGQGAVQNLSFTPDGGLTTQQAMRLCRKACMEDPGANIRLATVDPCGRVMWLDSNGTVWVLAEGRAIRIAVIGPALAMQAQRFIAGQSTAGVVASGKIIRLDARSGARLGSFGQRDVQVVDAVADTCDGVIVVETTPGPTAQLRRIRVAGHSHVIPCDLPDGRPIAMTRAGNRGPISLLLTHPQGWQEVRIIDGEAQPPITYPADWDRQPGRVLTGDGQGRLFLLGNAGIFAAGFGLVEPVMQIIRQPGMGTIVDLIWADDRLWIATTRGIFALDPAPKETDSQQATYFSPVLHSPPLPRSGWQRADLLAALPRRCHVEIRSRSFETEVASKAYMFALRADPTSPLVTEGWDMATPSSHFGTGENIPLRHHLGDLEAPYLALRIDVSLPAGEVAAKLTRLDVIYPDRSLVDQLPAIYRTDDGSEAQFRRMLAPFQALANEIDDLIGDAVRRLDPASTDDLWVGFLLNWLGHGAFSRLPVARRRALLLALPAILQARGTLRGLAQVMDALAPQGYAIEDGGLVPDFWVLTARDDPAGARLGRETHVAPGAPLGMRLGRDTLGGVHIDSICQGATRVPDCCSAEVTVRVWGGQAVEDVLSPFIDRIARTFVPAHTRLRFVFDGHVPPDLLERGRPAGQIDDGDSLFTLDTARSLALGAWRLPGSENRNLNEQPASLDSAVLDGSLTLV